MLTTEQERDLVNFIIEDFGVDLDKEAFVDCCLQMFEDISGFECLSDTEIRSITNQLWSIYVKY